MIKSMINNKKGSIAMTTPHHISLLLACAMIGIAATASASSGGRIEAAVSGVSNAQGMVGCALFSSAAGFPLESDKPSVRILRVTPAAGAALCVFDNVPPGTYAIAVVHDTNGNGRADTNFLGMPTEGVGVSNNVMPRMSAPTFDANKFSVAAGHVTRLAITLRY
jgi:uncharacterized protein (DUF2141 family)